MDSSDINYGSLFQRTDEVLSELDEVEEDLREKTAGYFEPGGCEPYPRYIGDDLGLDDLKETAERAAEKLNSIYHLQIATSDLKEDLDAGEKYSLHGKTVRGNRLKRRLRDLHRRITEESADLTDLAERLEMDEDVPVDPISMSGQYGIEDLQTPE